METSWGKKSDVWLPRAGEAGCLPHERATGTHRQLYAECGQCFARRADLVGQASGQGGFAAIDTGLGGVDSFSGAKRRNPATNSMNWLCSPSMSVLMSVATASDNGACGWPSVENWWQFLMTSP